ncbi:MAG: ABC transporter substrate-binding protein [Desulfobacteraceae bacterium]|nr:ABC transporter substrate-binding protein [Desulfobacteraceae bacterium]
MTDNRWLFILTMMCLLIGHSAAGAEAKPVAAVSTQDMTPMQTVQTRIDQIVAALTDPELSKPANKVAQRDRIWEIAIPMFDFTEISRRTVGAKWTTFSEAEQKRFTDLFTRFLGNTYLDKIQGEYHNEKVTYLKELIKEPQAVVRTKLVRDNAELPIDYRMKKEDGQWKIYDILVEDGVSLVQNYRVQFQTILQKETPAQLIERLEVKIKEQQAQPAPQTK